MPPRAFKRTRYHYTLHGRSKVPSLQPAAEQIVTIALDSADGNIARCLGVRDVEPYRDMFQLGALQLVNGACIARANGVYAVT